MSAKQKVTLYIPDELHRQFKIRSAVDGETMSSIAQRAIEFYLENAHLVESASELSDCAQGQAHRIHSCPSCSASIAIRAGKAALIAAHSEQPFDDLIELDKITELSSDTRSPDEGELVTC
ncbi:MAG: hypothetical protein HLUCCA11_19030 [Phormidesmis priestleyi Ana]|uniref:Ribbon-helix-helix protein, copG family n=1 Tax=Phormidesmis priestleyi Ana TaxID=1666911 RepID=A0A0N8KMB2_9CYAN|nr:MAG: hypothetical protein HLUCCA11_19030 [Phormidesmis priestleyi Ana]